MISNYGTILCSLMIILMNLLSSSKCYAQLDIYDSITLNTRVDPTITFMRHGSEVLSQNLEIGGVFVRDNERNVWLFTPNETWKFSLDSLSWILLPKIEGMRNGLNADYSSFDDHFLFWDKGLGSVYTWKRDDPSLNILYESPSLKSHFAHSWYIDSLSGDINSFGGRGFGEDRGSLHRFDRSINQWNIIQLNDTRTMPKARNSAVAVYDSNLGTLHIFGGSAYRYQRQDISTDQIYFYDYWTYDVNESKWTKEAIYALPEEEAADAEHLMLPKIRTPIGVIDKSNGIIWHTAYRVTNRPVNQLLAYDLSLGYGALTPIKLLSSEHNPFFHFMTLDEKTGTLYMFWSPEVIITNDNKIINVSSLKLPPASEIKKHLIESKNDEASMNYGWISILLLSLFLTIGFALLLYKKTGLRYTLGRGIETSGHQSKRRFLIKMKSQASVDLIIRMNEKPHVQMRGKSLDDYLNENELSMFIWLTWKYSIGQPFHITDRIEDLFFSDQVSLDYARKYRNISLKKLNDQLNLFYSDTIERRIWVVERTHPGDKRKREYGLNLKGLNIIIRDGDVLESSVHTDDTKSWLIEIKTYYRNQNSAIQKH